MQLQEGNSMKKMVVQVPWKETTSVFWETDGAFQTMQ